MIDLHIGEILNSKNFNILMFAGAFGLGFAWSIRQDNVYFLLGFIVCSVYSIMTFFLWLYRSTKIVIDKNKKIKIIKKKNKEAENNHNMWVRRIFSSLDEEEKQSLASIIEYCHKDEQYDDSFRISKDDQYCFDIINEIECLKQSTKYRVNHRDETLIEFFDDSPRFYMIYIDKELIKLVLDYNKETENS